MPRRGTPTTSGTIHNYFTRLNKLSVENQELFETTPGHEIDNANNMAGNEGATDGDNVSNAELRTLLLDLGKQQTDLKKDFTDLKKEFTEGFSEMREKVGKLDDKVGVLEFEVDTIKKTQSDNQHEMEDLKQQVEDLRASLLHTQTYSRKYHLLLYGVEGYESSPAETIKKVRAFAKDSLKQSPEFSANFTIRHAHRLQRRHDNTPTPIIVAFMYWGERDMFLRGARNLKGSRMSVRTDLPPVLKQKRGMLARLAFEIRRDEHLQTRVREKGIDLWLETRKNSADTWTVRATKD